MMNVITRPFSITELSRVSGIGRLTIYLEIQRGCIKARRLPGGGKYGYDEWWGIEPAEARRWMNAYLAETRAERCQHDHVRR
jgi:hypothetical protein